MGTILEPRQALNRRDLGSYKWVERLHPAALKRTGTHNKLEPHYKPPVNWREK